MADTYKICLLGEGRVGKTSLVRRYTENCFDDKEISTVQANMYSKKKLTVDDKMITISIWDTAGQERFHALGPIYYRDAQGALLVYDITDHNSFERVQHWVKELKNVVGEDIELTVAGNKCDLDRNKQVTEDEALQFCKEQGAVHFYTSAKLDKNVKESFSSLATRMVRKRASAQKPKAGVQRKRIQIEEEDSTTDNRRHTIALGGNAPPPAKQNKKCCG